MQQTTLCFLVKEDNNEKELLLAMKKRGFGENRWNGVGGKFDPEKDKDISNTAIREMKEEIGVTPEEIKKVAILSFYFPYKKDWSQDVHVFFAKNWRGEPKETEEMKPKWFKIKEIPFDKMWPDDKYWLPRVLKGERIKAEFVFKLPDNDQEEKKENTLSKPGDELIDSYKIKTI